MQVSKKKTSQVDHKKPVFKNITSQSELKREIAKYLKQKESDLENKLVDGIEEAKEEMQREKIRKKEENIERNKAKEYLNKQALEITGYDSQYLNELYEIAEKHPREFNEIMKKSKIDELLKEFDEYKQVKEDEEIRKVVTPEKIKQAAIDVAAAKGNVTEEQKIGAIIAKKLKDFKSRSTVVVDGSKISKTKRSHVLAVKWIPELQAALSDFLDKQPTANVSDVENHMKDVYDVIYRPYRGTDLDKIKDHIKSVPKANKTQDLIDLFTVTGGPAVSVTGGPAAASAPPAPTQVAHGLSGYIGGKVIKDVLKRFNVLVGEASSGNTSPEIKAEIFDIVDFLYKNHKITKPQMNQVVRAFRLDKP